MIKAAPSVTSLRMKTFKAGRAGQTLQVLLSFYKKSFPEAIQLRFSFTLEVGHTVTASLKEVWESK